MTQIKFCLRDEDHIQALISSWLQEELYMPYVTADCGPSKQEMKEWGILKDVLSWLTGSSTLNDLLAIQHHVPEDRTNVNLRLLGIRVAK